MSEHPPHTKNRNPYSSSTSTGPPPVPNLTPQRVNPKAQQDLLLPPIGPTSNTLSTFSHTLPLQRLPFSGLSSPPPLYAYPFNIIRIKPNMLPLTPYGHLPTLPPYKHTPVRLPPNPTSYLSSQTAIVRRSPLYASPIRLPLTRTSYTPPLYASTFYVCLHAKHNFVPFTLHIHPLTLPPYKNPPFYVCPHPQTKPRTSHFPRPSTDDSPLYASLHTPSPSTLSETPPLYASSFYVCPQAQLTLLPLTSHDHPPTISPYTPPPCTLMLNASALRLPHLILSLCKTQLRAPTSHLSLTKTIDRRSRLTRIPPTRLPVSPPVRRLPYTPPP